MPTLQPAWVTNTQQFPQRSNDSLLRSRRTWRGCAHKKERTSRVSFAPKSGRGSRLFIRDFSLHRIPSVSIDSAPPDPTPARSFWQRRVRDPLVLQLTQGITPHKIALTIAVGSAVALFPILGTTTLLCFLIGLVLKLNQPIIQLINQAFWPVHVPAIFACVRLGERIMGARHSSFAIRHMKEMLWHEPARFFHDYGITALHATLAWVVIAPFYIAAVYYVSLPIIRSINRLKAEATAKASANSLPPEHPVP
jgi:uncharacterized protein (DUF2062 family)